MAWDKTQNLAGPQGPTGAPGPQGPAGDPSQGVPPATIVMYWGNTAPAGWTLCDGTNGSPDLRDRFIIVANGAFALGAGGGSFTSTLPHHGHSALVNATQNVSWRGANQYGGGMGYAIQEVAQNQGNIGVVVDPVGSDPTWANMPPFVAVTYIMKMWSRVISKTVNGRQEDIIEYLPFDPPCVTTAWVPPVSDWKPPVIEVPAFIPANEVATQVGNS